MATKAKPKAEEPAKPNQLLLDEHDLQAGDDKKDTKKIANRLISQPEVRAAIVIQTYGGDALDVNQLRRELAGQIDKVKQGDMGRMEGMLVAQAHTLDALFSSLATRSYSNSSAGYLEAADRYMRLALKAQAQAVRTIEALGELKNPRPVTFVRQANVAHNQQVNNHPSQAGENQKAAEQTISGATYELLPDSRASSNEGATYPPVATLETLDRAEVARG